MIARILPLLWTLLLGMFMTSYSQIRIEVVRHAKFLSNNQRMFIAGTFNNWQPGDPDYELKRRSDGTYFIDMPDDFKRFEYKITQGSWALVESQANGENRVNRKYDALVEPNPKLINIEIEGWENKPVYHFVIQAVPSNTPADAALYIAGNFNNWTSNDENYRLQKQYDGTYRVIVVSELERLDFKFTRGTWDSVEGLTSGKARPNRQLYGRLVANTENIPVTIESWEDLSGTFNFFSFFDLLLLFSAFHSILLIIAITSLQDYNRQANRWLIISLGLTAVLITIKVVSAYRTVAQDYTWLLFLPDFMFFLYAPIFYFYIQKLLFKTPKFPRNWWVHFVPATVQFFLYLPYWLMNSRILQIKIVNQESDIQGLFIVIGIVAWIYNVYYWFECRKVIRTYKQAYGEQSSYEQNIQYLSTVLNIQLVCLVFWLFEGVLYASNLLLRFDFAMVYEQNADVIWLIFSTIPYFLGYFAIQQPEIFKLHVHETNQFFQQKQAIEPLAESVTQSSTDDILETEKEIPSAKNLDHYRENIDSFMLKNKPYTNTGLTLNELALKLKMPPHQLSKIINEVYQKNFFDFVNEYRIEEFKERFEDPRNKQYTMLAIAFEVGFNSKTAFNRAFKKKTQQTPREYFFDARLEE
jgi:AraC-like DNA-binding protein